MFVTFLGWLIFLKGFIAKTLQKNHQQC